MGGWYVVAFPSGNSIASGSTGLTSITQYGILYGNGTSPLGVTSAAANSVLVTDGSNIPSLSQTLPSAVQANITSLTGMTGAITYPTGLTFDGTSGRTMSLARNTGTNPGQGLTIQAGAPATTAATNNLAGGSLTLSSGISEGTGTSSILFQTAVAGSTGNTDNAPATRMTLNATQLNLASGIELDQNGTQRISSSGAATFTGLTVGTATYPAAAGSAGNVLVSDGTNWTSTSRGGPYGDGSDGTWTFDGNTAVTLTNGGTLTPAAGVYTLTRDIYLSGATVSNGGTHVGIINTAGFRIFCTGTITVNANCYIQDSGADGAAGTASTGGAAGGAPAAGMLGGGTAGGVGRNNAAGTAAATGPTVSGGGGGGLGGQGSGTKLGGAGGAVTVPSAAQGGVNTIHSFYTAISGLTSGPTPVAVGGGGGGGGGGSTAPTCSGGGGGGGGGVLLINARSIVNNGIISADGGDGGAGGGTAGGAGGGGAGGGGVVLLIYNSLTGNTPTAAGGTGGALFGTGTAGANGTDGKVVKIQN